MALRPPAALRAPHRPPAAAPRPGLLLGLLLLAPWGARAAAPVAAPRTATPPTAMPPTATAQAPGPSARPAAPSQAARAAARRQFERGSSLYREGRYPEAAEAFEAAYQSVPNPVVLYNLGQCYERMGQLERAVGAYQGYLREVPGAEDRGAVQATVASLEERLAAARRPRVSIASSPSGAALTLDGTPQGTTPWAGPLEAGPHRLGLTLEGHLPLERAFEVRAGEPLQLELALAPRQVGLLERPRTWTWVSLGAAGLAAAGGALAGTLARNDARALTDRTLRERAEADALYRGAQGKALAANVLYGVAGAGLLAGGALFFVEGSF
jgi:tetratricopeptide (TPR) repeat protein